MLGENVQTKQVRFCKIRRATFRFLVVKTFFFHKHFPEMKRSENLHVKQFVI